MNKKTAKMNLTIRIPPTLNKQLDKHVAAMGMTKSAFILSLINQALDSKGEKKSRS